MSGGSSFTEPDKSSDKTAITIGATSLEDDEMVAAKCQKA